MIIEELKIGRFAGFENKTFNFSEGINLIEGENESGKSSIAEFIRFIFYGVRADQKPENALFGYLVLSCKKGRFRIERSLSQNGGQIDERVTIVDLQINAPLKGKDPAAMFLGVSENVFDRSCFFGQFGARDVGGKALSDALENMISSADEQINAEKSAKLLKAEIIRLQGENEEEPDSLSVLLKEKDALSARHEKACAMEEEYKRTKESYTENKKKVEGNRKALAECKAQLGHSDALRKLERIKRANEAKERLENCQKLLTEHSSALASNDFLPDASYVKELQAIALKGRKYEEDVLEKEGEIAALEEELASIPLPQGGEEGALLEKVASAGASAKSHKREMLIGGAAAVLLTVMSLVFFFLAEALFALWILILAIGVGLIAFLSFMKSRKARKEEARLYAFAGAENREQLTRAVEEWARRSERRAGLEKQIEENCRKKEKAEEGRAEILKTGAALAKKWGKSGETVAGLEQLSKKALAVLEHLNGLESEEKQARIEYSDLQIEYTAEELKELLEIVKSQSTKEELTPEEYKKLTMKVNFYDQTSRALEERTKKQEEQMTELEKTMEDAQLLAHRLKTLEDRILQTEERIRVLTLAHDSIILAVERMRAKILPGILEDSSEFLAVASAGRYTALLTGEDFSLTVKEERTGKEKTVEQLSAAMGDLTYIALRMAVSARLYGDEPMMMVFDESFSHLDDLRLAALFMALAKRAEKKDLQLFFMTCRKREAALFEKLAAVHKITLESKI